MYVCLCLCGENWCKQRACVQIYTYRQTSWRAVRQLYFGVYSAHSDTLHCLACMRTIHTEQIFFIRTRTHLKKSVSAYTIVCVCVFECRSDSLSISVDKFILFRCHIKIYTRNQSASVLYRYCFKITNSRLFYSFIYFFFFDRKNHFLPIENTIFSIKIVNISILNTYKKKELKKSVKILNKTSLSYVEIESEIAVIRKHTNSSKFWTFYICFTSSFFSGPIFPTNAMTSFVKKFYVFHTCTWTHLGAAVNQKQNIIRYNAIAIK